LGGVHRGILINQHYLLFIASLIEWVLFDVNMTSGVSIDAVIPTLNCASNLRRCLERLLAQRFEGVINVIVVDGGSRDNTLEVAKEFDARILTLPGSHPEGRDGQRSLGIMSGNSEFVWHIDSDNFLVEDTVARDLVEPFLKYRDLYITMPETVVDFRSAPFNQFLSYVEIENVNKMKRTGLRVGNLCIVDDVWYGLTNASMIRRSALEMIGGWDMDTKVLKRLRMAGLSRGAIVTSAHFYHNQTVSLSHYFRKWEKRVAFFGAFTPQMAEKYFVRSGADGLKSAGSSGIVDFIFSPSVTSLKMIGNKRFSAVTTYGLLYPFVFMLIFLKHPVKTLNAVRIVSRY
jgi:glycosyltransferase involved in cell wall biosynthesis